MYSGKFVFSQVLALVNQYEFNIDLRGNIPEFIFITDGKYHDSNALDVINFYANAIYLMDKAYVDYQALYRINNAGAFSFREQKTICVTRL